MGKSPGLRAFENPVHVACAPPVEIGLIRPVGDEPTGVDVTSHAVHGGQTALRREICDASSMEEGHWVRQDQDSVSPRFRHRREGALQLLGSL